MTITLARLAGVCGLVLASLGSPALACSTCKCGDPTITLLGSEKAYSGRFRAGLDLLWRSESQGPAGNRQDTEEFRSVLGLAFSPTPSWTLAVQMPWVDKTLTTPSRARQSGSGWGDADLSARYVMWRSGPMSGRHLGGLHGGLRVPSGDTLRDGQGRRLDIDAQPDAGALAPNLGAWYAYHRFPWFVSASALAFAFGDGRQGFEPGDALVASLSAQYGLSPRLALQVGLDGRHAERHHFDGLRDSDSGGSLLMARLGLAARLGSELVTNLAVQIPALDRLHGAQQENPSLRLSLAYDF